MTCMDVGCGGGDVSRELARRVGAGGRVVGLDMDTAQLEIVRAEATGQNITNIDYRLADVNDPPATQDRSNRSGVRRVEVRLWPIPDVV